MKNISRSTTVAAAVIVLVSVVLLSACSLWPQKSAVPELPTNPGLLGVRLAWSARVGKIDFPIEVRVDAGAVMVASSDGTISSFDAGTGAARWSATVKGKIGAGVGGAGGFAALVTRDNDLVALQDGRELWQQGLATQAFTPPLIAGGRVFLLGTDRSVTAFDAKSGRRIWSHQRPGESLVLRQAGVLLAVGDTLVAGLAGRLVGLNPLNGSIRWEVPIASPRGTNDIERLVDLVGEVARVGEVVCARAFQAAVGCVDAAHGTARWTQAASGSVGVAGDESRVFGTESDGRIIAWRRADGQRDWTSDSLRHRGLTAPLVVGRSVAVGDSAGWVHWLSRADGSVLTRMPTDGSGIAAAPVLAGGTVVVVTRSGGIFGFKPD